MDFSHFLAAATCPRDYHNVSKLTWLTDRSIPIDFMGGFPHTELVQTHIELLSTALDMHVTIKSYFTGTLDFSCCLYHDVEDVYYLVLESQSNPYQMLYNLAHEMRHVYQIHTKQLVFDTHRETIVYWRGQKHQIMNLDEVRKDTQRYREQPWETDADRYGVYWYNLHNAMYAHETAMDWIKRLFT